MEGPVPSNVIEALGTSHQLGIFLRVDTDPALHLCFGVNDMQIKFDSIDEDGTIYNGAGQLLGIPSLEVLVNGKSDSVEFTLSGVDAATATRLVDSLPPVRGADVMLGITTLDHLYQPMSSIIPIWSGVASHVSEASAPVEARKAPTLTLALSVVSGEPTRSRPARSLWSSAHQKAISPDDKFCDGTARLASRGVNPPWGLGY